MEKSQNVGTKNAFTPSQKSWFELEPAQADFFFNYPGL